MNTPPAPQKITLSERARNRIIYLRLMKRPLRSIRKQLEDAKRWQGVAMNVIGQRERKQAHRVYGRQ